MINCPQNGVCQSEIILDSTASLAQDKFNKSYIKLLPNLNQKTLKLSYKVEAIEGIADSQYIEEIFIPLNKILKTGVNDKQFYATAYYGKLSNNRNGSQYQKTDKCGIRLKERDSKIYLEIEIEDLVWNNIMVKIKT